MLGQKIYKPTIQKFIGGMLFGIVAGGIGFSLASESPSEVIQGIIIAGIAGGYSAITFEKAIGRMTHCWREPTHIGQDDCDNAVVSGFQITRYVLIIGGIPFVTLVLTLGSSIIGSIAIVLYGWEEGIQQLRTGFRGTFWISGAFTNAVIMTTILSFMLQSFCRKTQRAAQVIKDK